MSEDITKFVIDKTSEPSSLSSCPCRLLPEHQTTTENQTTTSGERIYYGNAEPEGKTVVVGGNEVVVGGWAAYEATRREAHWAANPHAVAAAPAAWYGGRTYVSGQDAVDSLVTARCRGKNDPLEQAEARLASAIEHFDEVIAREGTTNIWMRLGVPQDAPVAVSTITAEDVRHMSVDTDLNRLHRAAEDIGIFVSAYARTEELPRLRPPRPPRALPSMPVREIPLRGKSAEEVNRAVTDLERASVPRAAAIEAYRGEVAAVFDAAASVLERAVAVS